MQKFATTAPVTAVLDIPAGRVQLIAADRSDVTVEVRPANASKSRDVKAAERTTIAYDNGVLRVVNPEGDQHFGPSGSVEVTVQLPAGSGVEVKAKAAELRAVGRLGDLVFDGAYRHVKVDEAAGLRLTATDGDVEVKRLTGPGDISTARGDITVAEATGGKLTLTTQSGDITVTAAAGVSAALDAGTSHGRVTNSLKNDGSTTLDIRATTRQGDITARSN
ncbi:hypothetical protein CG723_41545 [Streptomyces sp. CB01635]|uniref:DUF4097 family beta strand repeat-containing protein n=1 Tax=unclassified Streptomyces TaxID=2593676 RepID=UPI000C27379F|nr:DUF4097 family beta strand repeat-containing protein [Streptomyces sp. CB01635]PJN06078.1 hypothetical protein CG723_41545 [Streptomyces sp. CB01635]